MSINPSSIVRTWRTVEQHRFGRPDSVYTDPILGEIMRDVQKLIQQFGACCTESDFGQAIRNAADKIEEENPDGKWLRLSRRQVVDQLHVVASARRVAARSPLSLGDGKADGIDDAPTGLIWLETEFPVLWSNWRESDGILPFPAFWHWQRDFEAEKQAMPIIKEVVRELLLDSENARFLQIGKTITANRCNEMMSIACDFYEVGDMHRGRYFLSRPTWNDAVVAEILANIEAYNLNRVAKIKFDPASTYERARNEAIAFIYGTITLEINTQN